MSVTVDDIQSRVAGIVDQNQDTSVISSDDYALRLNYINRRERAWSEVGKWDCLIKEYNTLTSTASGNCVVSLPSDFRSFVNKPEITFDGVQTRSFTQIRPQEEILFDLVTTQFVKVTGNPASSYTMTVNPGTADRQLASGASIKVLYFATPAALASPADVVTCPNPDYLVQGVIADIWESQEDARFQGAKADANIILANMLEYENIPNEGSYNKIIRSVEQKYAYKWGK